jgi:hypothetical protein
MAYLADDRRAEIIDAHGLDETTEQTITDEAVLEEELSSIRERGYALDDEERIDSIRSVAAPIFRGDEVLVREHVRASDAVHRPTVGRGSSDPGPGRRKYYSLRDRILGAYISYSYRKKLIISYR